MANPVVIRRSGYYEDDAISGVTRTIVAIYVPGVGTGAADAAFHLHVTACMRTSTTDIGNYRTYEVQYRMTGGQIHSLDYWEKYEDADPGFDPRTLVFGFISYELTIGMQCFAGYNRAIVDVWGVAVE